MTRDDHRTATVPVPNRASRRPRLLRDLLRALLPIAAIASVLVLGVAVAAPEAKAASWHTKLSGSGHAESRTFGPATMYGGRETRLKYWTAKKWDADDGEWEYDWVKFTLIRGDTGATVKTFGPYYSPTGYQDWHTASVTLPSGGHPYKLKVTCDDARWGFKLQQKY